MMKYTRWLQWRIRLICVPAAMFSILSAQAQTPLIGGPGGGQFTAQCPPGQILGGVQLRVGAWIDAIRPLCRTSSVDVERRPIQPGDSRYKSYETQYDDDRVTYPVSEASATTDWYGGTGGHVLILSCDIGLPYVAGENPSAHYDRVRASGLPGGIRRLVVSGIYVEAEGKNTVTVDRITLRCDDFEGGEFYTEPSGGFKAPEVVPEKDLGRSYGTHWINGKESPTFEGPQDRYPTGESREVKGMSLCPVRQNGARTVAVGIHGRAGKWLDALGLICDHPVRPPTPVRAQGRVRLGGGSPAGPPRAICDLARQARARNSPAAPGLEAQCRAAGAAGEIAPVRAAARVKVAPTDAPTGPPRAICDVAREARARNSPAAPGLEQTCRAELAAAGAAIAQLDPMVAAARTAENDVLSRQGFDIATGIFGDPALGAQGRTATGPGSLGIRDQLTPAGQRGFNSSVTLHLSRDYRRASVEAAPTITANPNPVLIPNGQDAGTTTIAWTAAPAYTYSEIYLSVDNGEWTEFARGGDGSKPTTIKPGSSQTFRMMVYEGQAGTPKIVATLTVTAGN